MGSAMTLDTTPTYGCMYDAAAKSSDFLLSLVPGNLAIALRDIPGVLEACYGFCATDTGCVNAAWQTRTVSRLDVTNWDSIWKEQCPQFDPLKLKDDSSWYGCVEALVAASPFGPHLAFRKFTKSVSECIGMSARDYERKQNEAAWHAWFMQVHYQRQMFYQSEFIKGLQERFAEMNE